MCGIIACLSKNCIEYLLNGLEQLQNRGYDSAGMTTIYKNKLYILRKKLLKSIIFLYY